MLSVLLTISILMHLLDWIMRIPMLPLPALQVEAPITEQNLLYAFNEYRTEHQLQPVVWDESLCKLAKIRAVQIPNDWSHAGFFKLKEDYFATHPDTIRLGENLARSYRTTPDVIEAWDQSPTHKANLVNPHFTRVCFAINEEFIVQNLGASR